MTLQAPQLRSSFATSTQPPLHCARPGEHMATQVPDWQSKPLPHAFPHEPQLAGSLDVSTHAPFAHWVSGALHWHRPPAHCSRPVHARPHAPQFALFVCGSTHWPLQLVRPPVQPARHWPAWQAWP